jgi:hypothetical protein
VSATIQDRMDIAFERAQWRFPDSPPKWIYLDADDWAAFDKAVRKRWRAAVRSFSYRDVQIRSAKRSRLITKSGCIVCIPKHVSPMTRAA